MLIFRLKNPRVSFGFETAIKGTRGQHGNHKTNKTATIVLMTQYFLKRIKTKISSNVTEACVQFHLPPPTQIYCSSWKDTSATVWTLQQANGTSN
jgi:hypothetical protein